MPVALQIVSPAKELLARDVDMVVIPGSEGDLAAMEGHAPLIEDAPTLDAIVAFLDRAGA